MGKPIKFAVYLFLSLFSGFSLVYPCEIIYPAFSQPAIIKKGGSLNVTFEGKPNMTPFKAVLLNEYFKTPALVRSAKMESNYWLINITIPEKTPAELYDLKLTSAGCSAVEERSVKVTDNYKDTFVFIHISDIHIGHENGKSEEIFGRVIKEINLINPEFVLVTGDIVSSCENAGRALMLKEGKKVSTIDIDKYIGNYQELTVEEITQVCINQYQNFLKLLRKFKVPAYVVPGNHDMVGIYNEPSKKFYEEMIGKRYYSFDYGAYHFVGIDDSQLMEASPLLYPGFINELDEEQLKWLEEDLKTHQTQKLKFAFFHCPIHKKESKFREVLEKYGVDMTFAGHWHFDLIDKKYHPIQILTTSTAEPVQVFGHQHSGYRVIEIKEGNIGSYSYSGKYSTPYNQVSYEFSPVNGGKSYEVTCTIKNALEQGLDKALIRFIMPADADYGIINGELMQEVVAPEFKLLYVNVDVPPKGEIKTTARKRQE